MNKVGIFFAYWSQNWLADFPYYVKKASDLGFDCLELSTAYLVDMPKYKLGEIKTASKDTGIEVTYCIGFPKDKDVASADPTIRWNGLEYAKRTLDVIRDLGGTIWSGVHYSTWPAAMEEGMTDKRAYWERSIHSTRQVAKVAEELGITLCIEVLNRFEHFLLNTANEGLAFIEEVGSPNVKLLLDTFHMNIEEDHIGEAIIRAGDKLGHFHIGECNRKVPGKGHMPWDEIVGALKKIQYSGRIIMEPFVQMGGEVGRDIRTWRDLSEGADEAKLDADVRDSLEFIRNRLK